MPKIILPGQNVAIQTPQSQIEPLWYEKLKGWESWINLVSAIFPSGPATPTTPATLLHASLGADVLLNNITIYFDGPSVAQGTVGTWWVSGTVTMIDTAAAAQFVVKLWDGTTIISSGACTSINATSSQAISLSGFITSPVGNLRLSVRDGNSGSGKIQFNASGNSRDSTISAFRIA
jgi:hypothetical protein